MTKDENRLFSQFEVKFVLEVDQIEIGFYRTQPD